MSVAPLKSVIVPAVANHSATVVFLHGLGDSGYGWQPLALVLARQFPHVKWVLPNAPNRPISINMGMRMPGWYDIKALTPDGEEDGPGIKQSAAAIRQLIQDEIDSGIPASRIVLGGFSQGSAMSLYTALTTDKKFAGVIALSGYLPLSKQILESHKDTNKETPFLLGHGDEDDVVALNWGKMSTAALTNLGFKINFKVYRGMGHSTCEQEIQDITQFLKSECKF
ncbi:Phospholipase/carboxylesterase/thioesterase [Polychytrium aggregatum]|uniref:Phospholipase/carboxylesterase/thioesterase n=1 Tax=Polychytrium aggregatum TaxID=110093 RepID=UPI0022FE7CBB|nr:Phospholipase/carboxylesterase/thioesterase [Polychytrium aggregatum]KAI9197359.1 Phospholipase/carboxylesterase/thioesterase [Polychytrium aggregatum]